MFCPKCGQHVPEDRRFCSRCGLSISEVLAWLERGGGLVPAEESGPGTISARRRGMRFGAKTMFWGGIAFPVFLGLSIAGDSPFPLFVPLVILLAGLSIVLYSRLFVDATPSQKVKPAPDVSVVAPATLGALPPVSEAGVIGAFRREVRTAEIIQPPSVTDNTTRLLEDRQKLDED